MGRFRIGLAMRDPALRTVVITVGTAVLVLLVVVFAALLSERKPPPPPQWEWIQRTNESFSLSPGEAMIYPSARTGVRVAVSATAPVTLAFFPEYWKKEL